MATEHNRRVAILGKAFIDAFPHVGEQSLRGLDRALQAMAESVKPGRMAGVQYGEIRIQGSQ